MGSPAVRIAREEFVTPPEFRGFHAVADPAARVGGARIELIRTQGETRLGSCYQQIPTRVMPPFSFSGEPAALLYLINLTTGLMDGDAHLFEIVMREGTHAVVTGQSANRVHPALVAYATQQWSVTVENDACLVLLPGPTIPYRGCRYYQRARVQLAPRARLIWGDIWLPGRYERGELSERFQFDRIVQDFEARRGNQLVYRERFRWDGPWTRDEIGWFFGGHLASASLFVAGPVPEKWPEPPADLRRSVVQLGSGEHCVRWCGPPGAVTSDLVRLAMYLAAFATTGSNARPWLIHSSDLVPNHWFSVSNP